MRRCYICGREESHRQIVEPLMVPACRDRECARVAATLPPVHCGMRLLAGRLCGAPAIAQLDVDGRRLCSAHVQAIWRAA